MAEFYSLYSQVPFYNNIPKAEVQFRTPANALATQNRGMVYGVQKPLRETLGKKAGRSLPRFLKNLWTMLNDESIRSIQWSGVNSFVVSSTEDLCRDVLPKFFKHNRLSSFTRQLHMYQFEKLKDKGIMEWRHVYLNRGNSSLLLSIRRKQKNDDQKLKLLVEELELKIQDQNQQILQLKSRLSELEKEVKMGRERNTSLESQMFALATLIQTLAFPGSRVVPR